MRFINPKEIVAMKSRNTTTFVCNGLTGVLIRLRSTRLVVAAAALFRYSGQSPIYIPAE